MSLARATVPGAAISEFTPDRHYAIALAEYRYELMFFAYLSAYGGVAYLDRERLTDLGFAGGIRSQDDTLFPVGARFTGPFFFPLSAPARVQLQLRRDPRRTPRRRRAGGARLVRLLSS
jgi:hypothetical protein